MNIGIVKWIGMVLAFLFGMTLFGCSVGEWNANAKDGKHKTLWNHGFVFEWGTKIYIGPESGSYTDIENDWDAEVEGDGNDGKETEDGSGEGQDSGGADHSDRLSAISPVDSRDDDLGVPRARQPAYS